MSQSYFPYPLIKVSKVSDECTEPVRRTSFVNMIWYKTETGNGSGICGSGPGYELKPALDDASNVGSNVWPNI